ncbi:MAG: glycosyltransferase, partial [Ileibacterium sp.]|nr:glycosyltransferase [Ileibacterium sp.]
MPEVSVLMSAYKEEENQLRAALESILNQTYQDFEFLIFLDCPENESLKKVIESYDDPRIRFFVNEKNLGLTASLNRALEKAEGKYIARMDADDISLPCRLEKQKKYLEDNGFDLIGGVTDVIDENGKDLYGVGKIPSDPAKIKKLLGYNTCLPHPTWFGKKEVFDRLNGYRNFPYCEDFDFQVRAALQGFRLSNLNEPVLKYRMTKSSISRSNLYPQYLAMKFLTDQYRQNQTADLQECRLYLARHSSEKKAEKYSKANRNFNEMLESLHDKKYGNFFVSGVKTVFSSKDYLDKIYRLLRLSLNS